MARRATVVAALVVLLAGCGGSGGPTTAQYRARVAAVCNRYGRQLDQIPPPGDPAAFGDLIDSVGRALPILRAQARTIRALQAPHELQRRLRRLFALTDRSIAGLAETLHGARARSYGEIGAGEVQFSRARDAAKAIAAAIGVGC
jgi:hypothetical protein